MAKPNLTEVYEALRVAEAEGRTDDVAKLIGYIESVAAAPDVAAEETFDPRELISSTIPAAGGAIAGAIVPKIIESAVNDVKAGRVAAAKPSVTVQGVPSSALADIEEATTKGLSNEITQQTRTAQRAARTEQMEKILAELKAKGIPVNPKILAEMEAQYARPGSGILIPVERAREIAAQEAAATKAAPKGSLAKRAISQFANPAYSADIANFAKGVYDYKLPFVGSMGSLAGRGLVGAGAGIQGADAYNRHKMGDTTGSVISGIGALGTAANLIPHPAAKAIGTGVGLSAEAINAYRDAMRRGQIEHGAPEDYERVDEMGNAYAQGGLVHLAGGGKPIPNPEDVQGMFSYAPGFYAEVADNIVPEGRTAGPNDAARHMLAAADLTRRIGNVPLVGKHIAGPVVKGMGYGHEIENYLRGKFGDKPQTKEDMEQDLYNNALGIELGRNASSFQDIVNKVPGAVNVRPYRKEPGKAYIRNPQEVGTPYKPFGAFADGGQVQHFQAGRIVKAAQDFILPAAENAARTQIIGTLPTYGKAADIFAKQGATGQALDFGAGLGKGADLLGPGTHTYEPFAQGWNPTYTNAKDIPSDAYNRLTNLNVLNVVPRDVRDEMVLNIGRTMEPGGTGIITTRGADVMKAKGRPGPEPTSIITSRDTYQKGFTKQELEDYLRYMLGQGYDINKLNLGPAGAMIQKKAAGGLAHLAEGGQPPKPDANEGAAFIGYRPMQRQEKNRYGSGTGFLDALVGAPPSKENILDPRDLAYMQGYEKGEPYGIAAMALPFAGLAKGVISRAMPLKTLDLTKHQFLHGTSPEAKAAILESGKFDPHPARWPSYSYSEIGADTTYATPKQGWWLDKERAASGRAAQYKSAVGVDIDPSAKIAHIRNVKDWEKLAKKTGFKDGADMYRSLSAENLDSYNYAKNLTPQQYDQLQMERIQLDKYLNRNEKPGDFHYRIPDDYAEQINAIPFGRERVLNEQSILGPRAAVQKIKDKGYHGIYVDKHGNQDYTVSIPADEQLAIFDQSMIKPNPDIGYKKGGKVKKK